ncbi:hypothetical protein CSB09_02945 [Candidatus Gracilibacteria bacterium]|nr:MAG: hypothetical protein CSB09_02945 [Candidatus Gracilibacteria bacterium]
MVKKENTPFDIFVKKVLEMSETLIQKKDLFTLWIRSGGSKSRGSYALGRLMGENRITRIARDIYFVGENMPDIYEIYWRVVGECIRLHSPSGGYIGSEKALEIWLQNYTIPQTLVIYTRDTNARIQLVSGHKIHFRTLVSGQKSSHKNAFYPIYKRSKKIHIPLGVYVPAKEIALLEALSLRRQGSGVYDALILQFLERYADSLEKEVFAEIIPLRYIRAINRLREFARDFGYEPLYKMTVDIIRQYGGGCFVKGK